MKKISILVATHKKYKMPESKYYLPIHVGRQNSEDLGYIGDNTGDNISSRNPYYCELTGLYWSWKNLDSEYIGLVHYRRNFTLKSVFKKIFSKDRISLTLSDKEVEELVSNNDIILPKKRNYYIETLYSHYKHTMHIETLDETRNIIEEYYPEYLQIFDKHINGTKAHIFNMFIIKKEYLEQYCEWLFDILKKLELRIDEKKYDSFHARFYGRVSERLLDVWIQKNNLKYKEISVLNIEKTNWLKKGTSFLKAKFLKKKYSKSF